MKAVLTFCILFTVLTMHGQSTIKGIWNTGEDNTKIEIKESNGFYEGKLFSSANAKAKVGTLILKEVKTSGGNWKGKMYSIKKNKWFDAVLNIEGNQLVITVNAGWTSKTFTWSRG